MVFVAGEINSADFGQRKLDITETEMIGLIAHRPDRYTQSRKLINLRVMI